LALIGQCFNVVRLIVEGRSAETPGEFSKLFRRSVFYYCAPDLFSEFGISFDFGLVASINLIREELLKRFFAEIVRGSAPGYQLTRLFCEPGFEYFGKASVRIGGVAFFDYTFVLGSVRWASRL
jgi:hypothetical protein